MVLLSKLLQLMDNQKITKLLNEIIKEAEHALATQKDGNYDKSEAYIIAYYSSIIKYSQAIFNLIKSNDLIAIPTIF